MVLSLRFGPFWVWVVTVSKQCGVQNKWYIDMWFGGYGSIPFGLFARPQHMRTTKWARDTGSTPCPNPPPPPPPPPPLADLEKQMKIWLGLKR